MAEGQPQVVFYDLSQQQIELLYSEENIESIKVTETENGYDASITIVDATKMTQYGFSSAVDNISSKYDIHHVTRNDLFMDSLPNGGLLNQKNMVLMGVAIFIIIVSALVIYNVFYLSVVNQVRQFGQLRTVGMTQQQTKKIIRYERKILCRIGVPIGLLIGGLAGYLLQPDGWDWIAAVFWGIIISFASIDCGGGFAVPANGFFQSIRRGHREHFAVGTEFLQLCGAFAWGKKHRKIRGDRRGRLYYTDGICVQYLRSRNSHSFERYGNLYEQSLRYVGTGSSCSRNFAVDTGSVATND